jgi:hypothetical protein
MTQTNNNSLTGLFMAGLVRKLEEEVIVVAEGYARKARKFAAVAGIAFAVLGSLIGGSGYGLYLSGAGSEAASMDTTGQVLIVFGLIIMTTGILIAFIPRILEKSFWK